ncbi:hypothetical protein ACFYM0_36070 [Streptomyces sp. NPDC006487]|uniref:hypothetical protein n=1 Tax=Streptomyces sp. NPDC006487 TaxID=3364748 RepID=UPI0036A15B90
MGSAVALSASCLALAPAAFAKPAEDPPPVVRVNTTVNGGSEAAVVEPGDDVEVTIRVSSPDPNTFRKTCDLETRYVVPEGLEYQPGSLRLNGKSETGWARYEANDHQLIARFSTNQPDYHYYGCVSDDKGSSTLSFKAKVTSKLTGELALSPKVTYRNWLLPGNPASPQLSTVSDPAIVRLASYTPPANSSDLKVVGRVLTEKLMAGKDVAYEAKVTNAGPHSAEEVWLTSPGLGKDAKAGTVAAKVTLPDGKTADCSVEDGKVGCEVGDLAKGGSATIEVKSVLAKDTAGKELSFAVTAQSKTADPDKTNNKWAAEQEVHGGSPGEGTDPKPDPSEGVKPTARPSAVPTKTPDTGEGGSGTGDSDKGGSGQGGGGGFLAETGSNGLALAGGAAVLLGGGAGAVYYGRRRQRAAEAAAAEESTGEEPTARD